MRGCRRCGIRSADETARAVNTCACVCVCQSLYTRMRAEKCAHASFYPHTFCRVCFSHLSRPVVQKFYLLGGNVQCARQGKETGKDKKNGERESSDSFESKKFVKAREVNLMFD